VEDTWNNYLSPKSFKNVHMRLRVVRSCIVDDKGGNSLVETKRGKFAKLFRDATIMDLTEDDDENEVQEMNFDDLEEIEDISDD